MPFNTSVNNLLIFREKGLNTGLPKMLDTITRLDKISASFNNDISYTLTLISVDKRMLQGKQLLEMQKIAYVINSKNACNNTELRNFLNSGSTIYNSYFDKNGESLFTVTLTKDSCIGSLSAGGQQQFSPPTMHKQDIFDQVEQLEQQKILATYPDAKKATDGKWYVQRDGKWFLVNMPPTSNATTQPNAPLPVSAKAGPYLFDLLNRPAYLIAWNVLFTGEKNIPSWLAAYATTKDGPAMPGTEVNLRDGRYQINLVCQAHDCGNNRFYVLFSAEGKQAWGLLLTNNQEERFFGQPDAEKMKVLRTAAKK
jgi:hypothetical protein